MKATLFRWGAPETEHAKRIRFQVFCDEQRVPVEMELDEIDAIATHVLVLSEAGEPVATGRLFPDLHDPSEGRIGRMAVLREARGLGCGAHMLRTLIVEGQRAGFRGFVLDSQVHAMPFYERQGFVAEGPEHMDAGIPHREMRRPAAD